MCLYVTFKLESGERLSRFSRSLICILCQIGVAVTAVVIVTNIFETGIKIDPLVART